MSIKDNFVALKAAVDHQSTQSGAPGETQIIAATKSRDPRTLREAFAAGLRHFGENYVDEALAKQAQLTDLPVTWHFIGRIQSNKTRAIAENFQWIHSVDRMRIANRLSEQATRELNVLIQVNISADRNKGGIAREQASELAKAVSELPRIRLRGFMTILDPDDDPRERFDSMAQLSRSTREALPEQVRGHWDALSMGMSGDWQDAVAAGATHIRIGTAIFGPRDRQP